MEFYAGTFKLLGSWPPSSFHFEVKWAKQVLGPAETGSVISSPVFSASVGMSSTRLLIGFMVLFTVLIITRLFALFMGLFQHFQWLFNGPPRVFWTGHQPQLPLLCFPFARNHLGTNTAVADDTGNWHFTCLHYSKGCFVTDVGKFIKKWKNLLFLKK